MIFFFFWGHNDVILFLKLTLHTYWFKSQVNSNDHISRTMDESDMIKGILRYMILIETIEKKNLWGLENNQLTGLLVLVLVLVDP